MPKLITTDYDIHNAKQFVESWQEASNSIYYIFAAGHVPYEDLTNGGTDTNPPTPQNSLFRSYYDVYKAMIFGKKIAAADVYHMCRRNDWTSGTVYDMYDHNDVDIATKNFFVVVQEAGQYNVFKCLYNADGGQSTASPLLAETSADDDIYIKTTDGYQWKYMFTVSSSVFDEISTSDLFPIVANTSVEGNAVSGAIDVITVTSAGTRYFSSANAIVTVPAVAGNTLIYELQSTVGANVRVTSVSGPAFVEEKIRFFEDGANVEFSSLVGTFQIENVRMANTTDDSYLANATIYSVNSSAMRITDIEGTYFVGNRIEGLTSGANSIIDSTTATKVYFANAVVTEANSSWLRVTEPDGEINNDQKVETLDAASNAEVTSVKFLTSALSANTDFFKNMSLYVKAGTGAGQIGTIGEYIVTGGARRVLMANAFATTLDTSSRIEITPRVVITGDGTGAIARAIVNTSVFSIDKVEVIARGSGYSYADATVQGNTGIINVGEGTTEEANDAVVSVIIGPKGGHGANPVNELYATVVGMSVLYNDTEGGNIPINNDFRTVGLIKNPLYANVLISFTPSASFQDGETVTQVGGTGNGASGVIISKSSSTININTVYGQFTTDGAVLGDVSTANGNITAIQANAERGGSDFQTFDQRTILTSFTVTSNSFIEDTKVIQNVTEAEGYIQLANSTTMALTRVKGSFSPDSSIDLIEQRASGGSGYHLGLTAPDLVSGSGEILYIENMKPISRASSQTERIKFYIDF